MLERSSRSKYLIVPFLFLVITLVFFMMSSANAAEVSGDYNRVADLSPLNHIVLNPRENLKK